MMPLYVSAYVQSFLSPEIVALLDLMAQDERWRLGADSVTTYH